MTLDLGPCARCGAGLPSEPHPQELAAVYVDGEHLLCARCAAMFSMCSHSCFLGQWIEERKRWPLAPPDDE